MMASVDNLDSICEDAEAEEIIALDVIDYVNINIKPTVIDNWVKKLAHGGKITIGGVDFYEVCKAVKLGTLSYEHAQLVFYGAPAFPFGSRRGLLTLELATNILSSKGLQIQRKQLADYRYVVEGHRA